MSTSTSTTERVKNLSLLPVLMVGFIDHMGVGLVYPLFAGLLFDHENSILPPETSNVVRGWLLGLLIALTPISQFFSCPWLGALSDSKGRKKALIIGLCMGITSYVMAFFGVIYGSLTLLLMYRFIVGVSDGTIAVAQAAIADMSTEENKARRFSLYNMALGAGFTMGPFIGGKLSDPATGSWCGYATPFVVAGVLSILNLIFVYFYFTDSGANAAKKVSYSVLDAFYQIKKALAWKEFHAIFAVMFFFSVGWSFFIEFAPLFLRDRFGFTTSNIGDFYAWVGIFYSLSSGVFTQPFLKWFAPQPLFQAALILAGCYLGTFIFVHNELVMWLYFPLLLFFISLVYPTAGTVVSNMADKDKQGEVLGVYQAVNCVAFGLSPLIAGSFVATYPVLVIAGGSGAMLIAALIYRLGVAKRKVETPTEA